MPDRAARAARPKLTRDDWLAPLALVLLIPVMAVAIVPNNQIFNAYLVWGDQQFDLVFFGTTAADHLAGHPRRDRLRQLPARASPSSTAGTASAGASPTSSPRSSSARLSRSAACSACSPPPRPRAPGEKIGLFWPVMFHILNTIGFAHMLPVSLALFAKLAPKAINATMIGLYYLAFFAANSMVGWVGGWYSRPCRRPASGCSTPASPPARARSSCCSSCSWRGG